MLKVQLSGPFDRMYRELVQQDVSFKEVVAKKVKWFRENPDDTRLDNHVLTGRLQGKFAFSITDDIRIVYEWLGKTTVRFLAIGGHPKVYPRS